jgi:hypothetical protein
MVVSRLASGPLRRSSDERVIGGGFLLLAGAWVVTILVAFVPMSTLPPLGLLLFLLSTLLSVVAAIGSAILAILTLARRSHRVPAPEGSTRVNPGLPMLLIAAAALSFIGERIVSISAAVHG